APATWVTSRPPPGTSGPPPRATRRPRSPRPRSTDPPQSPPRTAAGSPAAPRLAGRATAATRLVVPDPSAVSQPSSQPPPLRCCDDLLNPRSAAAAVTRMRSTASVLIVPANTVAPGPLRTGVLSPVTGASLTA